MFTLLGPPPLETEFKLRWNAPALTQEEHPRRGAGLQSPWRDSFPNAAAMLIYDPSQRPSASELLSDVELVPVTPGDDDLIPESEDVEDIS